jgi:CBS domain-containing protein
METTVAQVMTRDPVIVDAQAPIREAARQMQAKDIGDVLVMDGDRLIGVVTDRDIAIRAVAEDKGPSTPVGQICSGQDLTTVTPETSLDQAVELMRDRAIRRLPIVEGDRPVGLLSIGDIAIACDEASALAEISASEPNQ